MKLTSQLHTVRSHRHIFGGAAGTLVLRIFSASLTLILLSVLARILGVADYGTYTYALTWVYLLATPACLGIDRLLVRLIAVYHIQGRWDMVRGVLRWSVKRVLVASLVLIAVAVGICLFWSPYIAQGTGQTFLILFLALPFIALTMLKQSSLQGLQQVLRGQLPDLVFRPVFMLGLVVLFYFAFGRSIGAPAAASLSVVASAAAFLIAAKLLRNRLPNSFRSISPHYEKPLWTRHSLPLLLVGVSTIISLQAETIILGAIRGMEAVSYFTVAVRGAELISLALLILSVPLAPTYARLWAGKNREELERVARIGAHTSLLMALPVSFALFFFGPWFLSLFGAEFTRAEPALEILIVGHLVNVMMGSVEILLIMSGHEREVAVGTTATLIFKLMLCALLIRPWGVVGAAVARSTSLIVWNLLLLYMVRKKLAINPTVFGRLRFARRV